MNLPPYGDVFRKEGYVFSTLKPSTQPVPDMTISVSAGGFWLNGKEYVECSGGKTPVHTTPSSGNRWTLTYINNKGSIRLEDGLPSSKPVPPKCPKNSYPVALTYISATDTKITSDKMFDVRGFSTSLISHELLEDKNIQNAHTIDDITDLRNIINDVPSYNDLANSLSSKADITGTTFETFTLNKDQVGSPVSNVSLEVERGTEQNVSIRWNESSDEWEYTNDGVTFVSLSSISFSPATTTELGGIIVGNRLTIDSSGILSATVQTEQNFTVLDKEKLDAVPSNLDVILYGKVDKVTGKQLSTEDYTTTEKTKLSGLTNYIHPATHSADMITETVDHNWMTDTEKSKLSSLVNYVHPATHSASMITEDATHRFTSDTEKATWNGKATLSDIDTKINDVIGVAPDALNTLQEISAALGDDANFAATMTTSLSNKVDKVTGKQLSTEDYTTTEKTKLSGLTNYIHPATHSADMITETVDHNWFLDAERSKLAAIESNANNYIHPANHNADMITEVTDYRWMTDAEKSKLADLVNYIHPTTHSPLIIVEDATHRWLTDDERTKLTGLVNYVHPATHNADMITEDATHRFTSDTEKATWNGKAEISDIDSRINTVIGVAPDALNTLQEISAALGDDANFAATITNALTDKVDKVIGMGLSENSYSTAEKTKLSGIEVSANNYVHPVSHTADMITETSDHNWFLDAERVKLTAIEQNANNYVHPVAHTADMITEDATHRFTSDIEKTTWNGKQNQLFISTEQVGTGAEISYSHTLGYVPTNVFVSVTKTNANTDWSIVEGTHTSSNILLSVTTGVNFKIMAY